MLTIALTGGIASGKTAVSDAFRQLGVPVVDADIVAREVVAPGEPSLGQLADAFSEDILNEDGTLDRAALRQLIFSDAGKKRVVEDILHPAIKARSELLREQHKLSGAPYLIHVIPLLLETGQAGNFDRVIAVDVPEETQIARVMARDKISRDEALAIINSQASREDRIAAADDIIENTGTMDDITNRVSELHALYNSLSAAPEKTDTDE